MSEDPRSWIAGMFHHRSTNWLAGVLEDEAALCQQHRAPGWQKCTAS